MNDEQDIAPPPDIASPDEQTPPDNTPPQDSVLASRKLYDQLNKSQLYTKSYDDFQQQFSKPEAIDKLYQNLNGAKLYTKSKEDFYDQFFGAQKPPKDHDIVHTPIHDIRHLHDLASQPVGTHVVDPQGGLTEANQEDVDRNKSFQQQYEKSVGDLAAGWGTDPKAARRAIEDFSDEPDEQKLKGYASLAQDNPVYYGRLKDANDIRMAIAKSGPQGVSDANVFNHLQTAQSYDQLQHNIALQQELMTRHGLGQLYFEKLKQSQAPLINTLDPGLHTQYWNSEDRKLGLSDFQYAGLETEKLFQPDKYQQDVAILRENRGLDDPTGDAAPKPASKKGYAYDRGVENVLFGLENQGRQNTGQFIAQRSVELQKSLTDLKKQYQEAINRAPDAAIQKGILEQFQQHPLVQEAGRLDEGQQAIEYAESEDQRRFPLNYGDRASRLVKDALSSTNGSLGVASKQVLLGAGATSDNTLRFIKNTFVNLLGSEHVKAENAASNIGHQALTELAGYEGNEYSMQQAPLLVSPTLTKQVQAVFDDSALSTEQKNQKATDLIMNQSGQIKVNPKVGQQNLTGKSVLYSASNTIGQMLGIMDQSMLMGGLFGNAGKAQQMASAFVPMYASTQNQLYEQALASGEEKPLLRSHLDAAIISLASLINPDIKIVKGMIGVETGMGKLLAGVDESTWNKVLSQNKPLVDRMVGGTKAAARQLGLANLQYGLIVPTAQYLVHKNVLNENPNLGDSIQDGLVQANISMALPALLHGVWGAVKATEVNPMQKYSIVEAGLHAKENIEILDHLVETGQVTPGRADQIKEVIRHTDHILEHTEGVKTDGSPMTENEVVETAYQMLRKKILEGNLKNAPDPMKPVIEGRLHAVNQSIADLHTSDADRQKTDLNQLLTDNLARVIEKNPSMQYFVQEAIKRNEPEAVFREIYGQASENKTVDGKQVSGRSAAEEIFGKELVQKAFDLRKLKPTIDVTETGNPAQAADAAKVTEKPLEGAAAETQQEPVQPPAPSFLQSRHADTPHDEAGIVSGPNNKELSAKGRRDANDLAKDVEGKGIVTIIASGLKRSLETAKRVAEKIGAKVVSRPELNTWDIKDFDGLKDDEFKDVQQWFVENPDSNIYQGPLEKYRGKEVGESVNDYAGRIIPEMEKIEKENGPDTLVINHSNNMMLWDAYLKNGREWNEQARQDYLHAEKPEPATLTNKTENNAISEPGAGAVGAHPGGNEGPGGAAESDRMGPGQQGEGAAGEGSGPAQGQEPPGGAGGGKVAAGGEEEAQKVGPSHDALTALALRLGLKEPERGQVLSPKEYAARGRIMIIGGADPEKVARTFKRTGNVNPDVISVARAHLEDLVRAADKVGDEKGTDGPEYKDALAAVQKWQDDVVKPMGTRAGETFTSLQGIRDVDTGSFTSMEREYVELHKKQLTEKQAATIKEMAAKVKGLEGKVEDLTSKLSAAHDNPTAQQARASRPVQQKAKELAQKLRDNAKLNRPGMFSAATPASLVWDTAVEIVAKGIEAGGLLADAVAKGILHIQQSDWYKGLSDKDRETAEDQFTDWYTEQADKKTAARIRSLEKQLADLQQGNVKEKTAPGETTAREKELKDQIADQKSKMGLVPPKAAPQPTATIPQQTLAERLYNHQGNVFSAEDARAIWAHVKENYLDKDKPLGEALRGTSTDLGLSADQILHAIATPKGAPELTDELFRQQYQRNKAMEYAKRYVETAGNTKTQKFLKNLPSVFFNLKTYGHGTVGNITHAATNIFRPSVWSAYWPNVLKSFSLAYGSTAGYEKAVTLLESSPNFDAWKRSGLAVDPREAYDDYQVFGRPEKKTAVGKAFQFLGEAGTKGFTGLKLMRYDLAELWYNQASDTERADPKFREEVAKLANHATGHSEVKVPKPLKVITFAPGLEVSRWQRMITDPAKAANTFLHWSEATPAERGAAKIVASGAGQRLAIYGAALAANAGLLSALGSKQKVNFTDPSKSDWLKFKMADHTLDLTGGVLGPLRLLNTIGSGAYKAYFGEKKDLRVKPNDKDAQTIWQQLRYKEAPLAADITDLATGQDAMGNTLPWSKVTPGKGRKQQTVQGFAENLLLPIPFAAGFNAYRETMEQQGVPEDRIKAIWNGVITGTVEGFTGAKYQPDFSLEEENADNGRRSGGRKR